ncbi:kinase-like protein [Massarina eburnea CBS 473.64]|uniref:Aurora kinase n=1 Tax=Massarina eburnea CBS 473.64 TaxID=1395130 RepID=A0A6A6RP60_9PLEO|nr:kinase-like protein [Massarina eburnea CBS 473.64]
MQQPAENLATITEHEVVHGPSFIDGDKGKGKGNSSTLRPPRTDLTIASFELGGKLGSGQFGHVHLARHRATDYICALKLISKADCVKGGQEEMVRRELEVHTNLAHANILRIFAWFHDNDNICLVLEYAPNGTLFSLLGKQPERRFSESMTATYISQIAQGLRYMHRKNIIHRDIKPENILLGFHHEIKLADFGWSVHSVSNLRSTVCGTIDYLAPEIAIMLTKPGKTDQWYTNAVDQWSLGVLTYELLTGRTPFETWDAEATKRRIAEFKGMVRFPQHVSKAAEDFIKQLLNLDAEKRLGLSEVLQHPWILGHVARSEKTGLRSLHYLLEEALDD